ncbi:MAG: hypothetical protein J5859_06610 [Clostridia bacterium]|nr:hypothetical protein [Clostridia bacterium]
MKRLLSMILSVVLFLSLFIGITTAEEKSAYTPDPYGALLFTQTKEGLFSLEVPENVSFQVDEINSNYYTVTFTEEETPASYMFSVFFGDEGISNIKQAFINQNGESLDINDYNTYSEWLISQFGEPMYTEASEEKLDQPSSFPKGEMWTEAKGQFTPVRFETWILPMPDGTSMLLHHYEFADGSGKTVGSVAVFAPYSE